MNAHTMRWWSSTASRPVNDTVSKPGTGVILHLSPTGEVQKFIRWLRLSDGDGCALRALDL